MALQRFDRQQLHATPWKNGAGVTREIVCQPAGAGTDDFHWRVSIAHIASDGPFSRFDGVDRIITLLEGAGVRLHSTDDALDHPLLTPLVPFAFAGEAPVQGLLVDGDCHDFNVMSRRAVCRASVTVCRDGSASTPSPSGLLLAVHGHWTANEYAISPGQGLWWQDELHSFALYCDEPDAALLLVCIQPMTP